MFSPVSNFPTFPPARPLRSKRGIHHAYPEFVASLPEERAALLTGGDKYGWQRKLRDLATPAETV